MALTKVLVPAGASGHVEGIHEFRVVPISSEQELAVPATSSTSSNGNPTALAISAARAGAKALISSDVKAS
eukprot:CAMPEP_0197622068 /NCGR_PEP_ID=MMETSP1338-20131121/2465_1 /TAXON_ID=43686 ORGANISM="Pelagodinium beii, Strain RCC1491" /NCGR_SAMPLE_ID=MMETSP1338 /ASSEMBLY_ACC=CAM_ASM_000754 /LENGTH=70 /DNA_ID=CAMNT_0043191697 /DNA_START=369 /DNA_END=581 /DNA_ORIENTATION=+